MNRLNESTLHIARFTLQAKTALSIGSGGADGVYDHPIVRDANGLPCIPGTSLAGVLRHLWQARRDEHSADALFGYQDKDQGAASRVEVAACVLQDSHGQPVEGLCIDDQAMRRIESDDLLRAARVTKEDPLFRDRVRISHRGVAGNTAKFDRGLLAAGYRFSGELRYWSQDKDDPDWPALLSLLADPSLRLGGATRAGMGAMQLAHLHAAAFDLRNAADVSAFRDLGVALNDTGGLSEIDAESLPKPVTLGRLSIRLKPWDCWRFGQGNEALAKHPDGKIPDLLPKLEPMVIWTKDQARVSTKLALAPGSAIKGALAHRTAFHWNALNGHFVDDMPLEAVNEWDKSDHCAGVQALFGYAKRKQAADDADRRDEGQAGHVCINDVHIEIKLEDVQAMLHNSIDRFTGGVRNRMLFSEELIHRQPISLDIDLLPGVDRADESARRALARALRDLCEGRLALGAGVTKGHGSFTGEPDQPMREWLKQQQEEWA